MIQSFSGVFRLDQMIAWYATNSVASLFGILMLSIVLAILFHKHRSERLDGVASASEHEGTASIGVRTTKRLVRILHFMVILWVYWINAEFAKLDWGQRTVLYAAGFALLYGMVLTLQSERS